MITIKSLAETSFDDLYITFNEAFKDYERAWSKTEFEKMLHREGYVSNLSFGAFDDNKLVSFILNATGIYNNILTVYDTGTGTLENYRGQGLVTNIFKYSIPFLQQAGMKQYLLEVLQHNTNAVKVYSNLGFKTSREFNYFRCDISNLNLNTNILLKEIELQEIDFFTIEKMKAMWDFYPSWQNSLDSLLRSKQDFKVIGAFKQNDLIGYGIIEPTSGDIPQLAVTQSARRKGIGSAIFKELLRYNQTDKIKIINTDKAVNHVTAFIEHLGIQKSGSQYEMNKEL